MTEIQNRYYPYVLNYFRNGQLVIDNINYTRVDKVKPKGWFKYSVLIDKRNIVGLFHIDINLVLPKMNMSIMDAGILIMMQQVKLMIFSLNMVYYPISFRLVSTCKFLVDK